MKETIVKAQIDEYEVALRLLTPELEHFTRDIISLYQRTKETCYADFATLMLFQTMLVSFDNGSGHALEFDQSEKSEAELLAFIANPSPFARKLARLLGNLGVGNRGNFIDEFNEPLSGVKIHYNQPSIVH